MAITTVCISTFRHKSPLNTRLPSRQVRLRMSELKRHEQVLSFQCISDLTSAMESWGRTKAHIKSAALVWCRAQGAACGFLEVARVLHDRAKQSHPETAFPNSPLAREG